MAYSFRLATVLRVRRLGERAARLELAGSVRRLHEAESRHADALEWCGSLSEGLGPVPVGQFILERERAERAGHELSASREAVVQAGTILAESTELWQAARSKVRVLERLEERRRAEHAAAEARRELATLDELAALRWLRGGTGDGGTGEAGSEVLSREAFG